MSCAGPEEDSTLKVEGNRDFPGVRQSQYLQVKIEIHYFLIAVSSLMWCITSCVYSESSRFDGGNLHLSKATVPWR
jgi:hypothetical protein